MTGGSGPLITVLNQCALIDSGMSLDRPARIGETADMSDPVHLTRIDPAQNMARFYDISLQPTLFGEVAVLRRWGRIGTGGQVLMQTLDAGQAATEQARLAQAKRRRGYR